MFKQTEKPWQSSLCIYWPDTLSFPVALPRSRMPRLRGKLFCTGIIDARTHAPRQRLVATHRAPPSFRSAICAVVWLYVSTMTIVKSYVRTWELRHQQVSSLKCMSSAMLGNPSTAGVGSHHASLSLYSSSGIMLAPTSIALSGQPVPTRTGSYVKVTMSSYIRKEPSCMPCRIRVECFQAPKIPEAC